MVFHQSHAGTAVSINSGWARPRNESVSKITKKTSQEQILVLAIWEGTSTLSGLCWLCFSCFDLLQGPGWNSELRPSETQATRHLRTSQNRTVVGMERMRWMRGMRWLRCFEYRYPNPRQDVLRCSAASAISSLRYLYHCRSSWIARIWIHGFSCVSSCVHFEHSTLAS